MADFRKMLYAFALVALLTALTVPAAAQGLSCGSNTGVRNVLRHEGFAELVGDVVLECAQNLVGVSTTPGSPVPQATIRVQVLGTTFTSRVVDLATSSKPFSEALLLIDNPAISASGSYYGQRYCGQGGNDSGPSGAGVCNIIAPASADSTYDGAPLVTATGGGGANVACSASAYGCGRPNIFQGRYITPTVIEFAGVPLDPPNTGKKRVLRITNLRVNATVFDPNDPLSEVKIIVNLDSQASISMTDPVARVGVVLNSLSATTIEPNSEFVVCEAEDETDGGSITFNELFNNVFKPENVRNRQDNDTNDPFSPFAFDNSILDTSSSEDPQNDPTYRYFTEGGFILGSNGGENGIGSAGRVDTGTMIRFKVTNPPSGDVTVDWPDTVWLRRDSAGGPITGFAVQRPSGTTNELLYEIIFSDPFSQEWITITPDVSYDTLLEQPLTVMQAGQVILWPSYTGLGTLLSPPAPAVPSAINPIPRFLGTLPEPSEDFISIGTCTCNLLFPWVVSTPGNSYVTGLAISNTSKDPTNASLSPKTAYTAIQQEGPVSLYLFGTGTASLYNDGSSTPGGCTSNTTIIASGTTWTCVVSGISGGFAGYAIAQTEFQYCHGVASVFNSGSNAASTSYLGLVMDKADKRHGGYNGGGMGSYGGYGSSTELPRTVNKQSDRMDN